MNNGSKKKDCINSPYIFDLKEKMTMKKLKWFKRVISGALAVAVCATSLFSGVGFGVFKASAAGDSRLTLTPAL